ncbi:hypothetical protein ACOMHN_044370 [Nucella lapillus]
MSNIITGNSGSTSTLCPQLATPSTIITKDNVNALKLSSYNRTHGTTITVSCLAAPEYHLVGSNVLTCLTSSQWDKVTPTCQVREPISGGGFDITMVPMLVAAGTVGVLFLALICIMIFVACCWKQSKSTSRPRYVPGAPIGLFRSLSMQEAESIFSQRRQRHYAASECSDVIDSVSARCPSHTPEVGRYPFSDTVSRSSPTTYITALSRGTEPPYRSLVAPGHSYPPGEGHPSRASHEETLSRSSPTTYVTAVSRGGTHASNPPRNIRVGSGQPYRTWHELFYNNNSYT